MLIFLFIVLVLFLIGILFLILFGGKVEVERASAVVIKNIWSGKARVVFAGTSFFIPGLERIQETVSLKNEAENPSDVNLITSDGIDLKVDYLVRRLQVGYPGMPDLDDPTLDKKRLAECVIKAATEIKYAEHRDKVLTRMVTRLQAAIGKNTLNHLFPGTDLATGAIGTKDEALMKSICDETNTSLLSDQVTNDWGFWAEIDLEDYDLPKTISQAREEASSAKIAGKAIKEKANEAGISPTVLVIADALSSILGGGKK